MIVDFPEEYTDHTSPENRVGGFYEKLDAIEAAADLLGFDVLVPPKSKRGWFMVPASREAARAGVLTQDPDPA